MAKDRRHDSQNDLDARLRAYYGPSITEQPLSSSAWDTLSRRLAPQHGADRGARRRWHGLRGLRRPLAHRKALPSFVRESLSRVMDEARWQQRILPLYCSIQSNVREPSLHVASMLMIGKPTIYLTLPVDAPINMKNVEIDVLLATGLARTLLLQQLSGRLLRYICACLLLGSYCFAVYTVVQKQVSYEFLIAIGLLIATSSIWQRQKRIRAFKADKIAIHWLGRNQVCEGLHSLANRKRKPLPWRFGEPSLEKRIERVCGTRVSSRHKDLTLVG